jgi:hypothetical protein
MESIHEVPHFIKVYKLSKARLGKNSFLVSIVRRCTGTSLRECYGLLYMKRPSVIAMDWAEMAAF